MQLFNHKPDEFRLIISKCIGKPGMIFQFFQFKKIPAFIFQVKPKIENKIFSLILYLSTHGKILCLTLI